MKDAFQNVKLDNQSKERERESMRNPNPIPLICHEFVSFFNIT